MKMTRPNGWYLPKFASPKLAMPKFAQVTGMIVTSIVVIGTDADVFLAVPLGILAGGIATFFVAFSEYRNSSR